jgi:serine/threonine protein phosphatase PrpC/CRP-like cAMP-binding protein
MGCCESVEVEGGGRGSTQGSIMMSGKAKSNLRSVDEIEATKELICGGLRIRYAYVSQKGYYPDQLGKANQDAYSVIERFGASNSNDAFFGVYDGHGEIGDKCSQFARDKLPEYLKRQINRAKAKEARKPEPSKPAGEDDIAKIELSKDQMQKACARAHVECNKAMHQAIDDRLSGTTAISAYVHGRRNRMTICNVGDSRAVLGKTADSNGFIHGQTPLKAFPLSRDQTPYRKDERTRIRKTGARILSLDQLEGLEPVDNKDDDPNNKEADIELGEELDEGGDPPRVWSPNGDYPGTAFTRSLGDSMAEALGVFAEPEMLTREFKPNDRMIIIASDGVFEFLTNQSVVDICAKFADPLEACKAVVSESYNLWVQYELRTDDITIICMFVEPIAEAAAMEKEFLTSSIKKPVVLGSSEFDSERPVCNQISKEKVKEIQNMKQNAVLSEEDIAELKKEVDLDALYTEKTASEKVRIADAIKTSAMFRNITDEQRELIYGVMEPIVVKKGDWVIKQGAVGDRFYIIDEGTFEVRILKEGEEDDGTGGSIIHHYEGSLLKHLHPIFGELALMYSAPRSASVIARTDGVLFGLHRSAFRQVLAQGQGTRKELMKTIAKIPLFKDLNDAEVTKLAVAFDEIAFGRGENIVEQNNFGDSMFVITSGTCGKI